MLSYFLKYYARAGPDLLVGIKIKRSEAHITKQQHMAERLFEGLPALAKVYRCNQTIQWYMLEQYFCGLFELCMVLLKNNIFVCLC